jgi:iron-sulfur cluster assembly accessory protein
MRTMATIEREALVTLTESAATKVKELMAEEPEGEATVLRVAVQGGGCSGFEYALGFDSGVQEGDHRIDAFGVPVVVDPLSAPYLQGTEIDFLDGLQGGFAINNPNVSSACGCGHSFQVEEGAEGEMPADGAPAAASSRTPSPEGLSGHRRERRRAKPAVAAQDQ